MKNTARKTAAALAAAALGTLLMTTTASASAAPASATSSPARSVFVEVNNWTGCRMDFVTATLTHGTWTDGDLPPGEITNSVWGVWASESNGFATGTEGFATYQLHACTNPANVGKWVKFHWNNPYVGSNTYDNVGTSSGVSIIRTGGSGNNAVVQFRVVA